MSSRLRHALALLVPAALAACGVDLDESTIIAADTVDPPPDEPPPTCPPDECGNAASVGTDLLFFELEARGNLANHSGLKIADFRTDDDVSMFVDIDSVKLYGRRRSDPSQKLQSDADLLDAEIRLTRDGEDFYVRIAAITYKKLWVTPSSDLVPVYTFKTRPVGASLDQERPLCKGTDLAADDDWAGLGNNDAVVFTGDRYDGKQKQVSAAPGNDVEKWFNVACIGTASAKMFFLRFTAATSTASENRITTIDERQAMFKALTADVCGTGPSFTVDGEPLRYDNKRGFRRTSFTGTVVEAVWGKDGPLCFDEPRRLAEDPDVWDRIHAECPGKTWPACKNLLPIWKNVPTAFVLTSNPATLGPPPP